MSDSITRVNYFEGQFLRTQDFTDEQAYHVSMRRRHNISHHTWGIVSGLTLVLEEDNFYVMPGMAVDGYGRELVLAQRQTLASSAFIDKGSVELDVWLVYGLSSSDKPPAGYFGCEDKSANGSSNGNGKASFYRSQETATVILERPNPDFNNRRAPEGLAIPDRNFDASRTSPDSPTFFWPVFLGQVINDPANKTVAVNMADRPYVGLVGEAINAPSGRARVQVGSERADDNDRFVVFTEEGNSQNPPKLVSRFAIDKEGELSIHGNASMNGNLSVVGAVEFEAGSARSNLQSSWNIYRVSDQVSSDELLIEIPAPTPGGSSGNNEVVIGAWFKGPDENGQDKEMFHPCLTISDDGTVEVSGNLVLKGQLIEGAKVAGSLTEAASNAAAAALMSGILSTSARLPDLAAGPPTTTTALAMTTMPHSPDALADQLAADPTLLESVAESLKDHHPAAAASMVTALS